MYKIKSILTSFSYHCSLIIFRVNRLLESLLQNTDHVFKVFPSVAECTSGVLQVFLCFFFNRMLNLFCRICHSFRILSPLSLILCSQPMALQHRV